MSQAVLSLGSNLGDRIAALHGAVTALGSLVDAASSVYQTPPWGDQDQPPYLNAVLLVSDAGADAWAWLRWVRDLEGAAGRIRYPDRRYGPRTLDVDVIAVWDDSGTPVVSDDPVLTLPHPRAHERAFVLVPWLEMNPDAILPRHGPVAALLRREDVASGVPDIVLVAPPPQ